MMVAQSALWTGLLYDEAALAAADALVRRRPWGDYMTMRAAVPRFALNAPFARGTVRDLARDVVGIAQDGLRGRAKTDGAGEDERRFLDPLGPLLDGGMTQAEYWLQRFNTEWRGDASRIFEESSI